MYYEQDWQLAVLVEPSHDKTNKMIINAHSDQSLCCLHEEALGSWLPIKHTAKTDQTGRMPRLIWVFAGHRSVILLVLLCCGSVYESSALHKNYACVPACVHPVILSWAFSYYLRLWSPARPLTPTSVRSQQMLHEIETHHSHHCIVNVLKNEANYMCPFIISVVQGHHIIW